MWLMPVINELVAFPLCVPCFLDTLRPLDNTRRNSFRKQPSLFLYKKIKRERSIYGLPVHRLGAWSIQKAILNTMVGKPSKHSSGNIQEDQWFLYNFLSSSLLEISKTFFFRSSFGCHQCRRRDRLPLSVVDDKKSNKIQIKTRTSLCS